LLRQKAATAVKALYRLTQALSRQAVDSHLENFLIADFVRGDYGAAYGVTRAAREDLVAAMRRVLDNVPSATRLLYHVVLARELLALPAGMHGDVIECGAYKGASSCSLSLACALVGRKLWVCDSFAGLPSAEADVMRNYAHQKLYGHYSAGMYAGGLDEVRANVTRYGRIEQCTFVPGLFADTLPQLKSQFVLAFLDVDLTSSMQDCIGHLWPRLVDGGVVYTDDSCDMEVIRVWFDDAWWRQHLGQRAPGYVGTGCGLPMSVAGSSLGYVRKLADVRTAYQQSSWLAP
jgi:O-methyltransferase